MAQNDQEITLDFYSTDVSLRNGTGFINSPFSWFSSSSWLYSPRQSPVSILPGYILVILVIFWLFCLYSPRQSPVSILPRANLPDRGFHEIGKSLWAAFSGWDHPNFLTRAGAILAKAATMSPFRGSACPNQ